MSIGSNIRYRRRELHMSQHDLAITMGYKTRSTIAKIESGENDVSHKKLQKFAAVLNTTVDALISGYTLPQEEPELLPLQMEAKGKCVAIILAGGDSARTRQNIPNQFVNIQGKPLIVYSMDAYQRHPSINDIYVVCLKGWESIVEAYASQYGITKLKHLIPAGSSGVNSLRNAIEYISDKYSENDIVFIQESTRPLVNTETISTLLQACSENTSATICHAMKEYVQFSKKGDQVRYIDRNELIAIQSPEAHRLSVLKEVFEKAPRQQHDLSESCCTMLLYNLGYNINFVEGNINNIKIAHDEDIATFSAMVKAQDGSARPFFFG